MKKKLISKIIAFCGFCIFLCAIFYKIDDYIIGKNYYVEIIDELEEMYPDFFSVDSEEQLSMIRNYVYSNVLYANSGKEYIDVKDSKIFEENFPHYVWNLLHLYDEGGR